MQKLLQLILIFCYLEINYNKNIDFIGSIETEFHSIEDMVFPYPALVLEYHNEEFNTCVHTLGRTL